MDSRRRQLARSCVVAALVLLGVTLGPASPAAAQSAPLDGMQLHPLWDGVTIREAARELDIARRAGADVVRVDVAWSSLELEGKRRWSRGYAHRLDAFVRNARSRGLRVVAVLNETPCWASKAPRSLRQGCFGDWWNRGVTRYPPRRSTDYADAAVHVARRWGKSLTALEIWNEPNASNFLRSPDPVRDYARLVRSSYRRVKSVAPRLTVLAGGLALSDGAFLTGLYERGRIRGDYDAISYHPYTEGVDPAVAQHARGPEWSFIDGTAWMHDIMVGHGDRRGELWATEAGVSTCNPAFDSGCVSEARQAMHVASYLRVGRTFPYLRAMVIYNLRDKGTSSRSREDRFGLVRRNLSPKPALRAFREAAR
jgi:polysaccharide biosynthesis protein PslG